MGSQDLELELKRFSYRSRRQVVRMRTTLVLSVLALSVAFVNAISFFEVVAEEWETWKVHHGKNYSDNMEEKFRLKIFMENKAKIARHNSLAHSGEKSYYLKMNHFGDLLHHEFIGAMNGYDYAAKKLLRSQHDNDRVTWIAPENVELPAAVDWRDKGAVTPVKNQGQCGSCWAFSTTGSLEGQHYRKTGELLSLSEQNLVDCSHQFGNNGCNGGLMDNAFRYIKANGGVDTESSYPYEGHEDTCHFKRRDVGETDKGFVDIPAGSERALKKAVATVGPVSVAIDASHESFQFYSHGVYDEPECDPEGLDHGVLVVGYGTYEGDDFWLVKNSWSEHWGLDGYIRMARNKDNQCGIASCASYPLV